jgi:hypothetical protein
VKLSDLSGMAIAKGVRDKLLVEAGHRCTICSEKAFELHHIIEQAEGGTDDEENLIVLCPNCHQHRYHRAGDITRDQVRLYKANLKEHKEIERRLLLNLEEMRLTIGQVPIAETEDRLRRELAEAAHLVSPERSPALTSAVAATSRFLAERETLKAGARAAIEVEWELRRAEEKARFPAIRITGVDHDASEKAPDFPVAYTLVLNLDRRPHSQWVQVFDHEYHLAVFMLKRRVEIEGSQVVMVVAQGDNLQPYVDFAKELVKRTNETIERDIFTMIDRKVEEGKRQALQEFDAIRSIRSKTKDLII